MRDKRKLKLKEFYFHPITMFIVLTIATVLLSGILSLFQMQATYNTVNANTNDLEPTLVAVESLLNFDGMKYIISNASKNFISFAPLVMLLISLIGISIAEATGFVDAFAKRYVGRISEILFNVWLVWQLENGKVGKNQIMELKCNVEEDWLVKIPAFFKAKFLGRKYENSF